MKLKLIFVMVLSLVVFLSACGPVGNVPRTEQSEVGPSPTSTEPASKPEPLTVTVETEPLPTFTEGPTPPEEVPSPVPTSRGPDLEATDPSTVALASSNLQLVEFFRFT